jgi:hypothetical protein
MLWGDNQISDFDKLVKGNYAKCVMGFNEPNQQGQSDMDAGHGAALWQQHIDHLHDQGYRTISPATTSAPSGIQWMRDFFKACQGCRVDVVALHYYGTDADDMIQYIESFYNEFKKPIWVTEFACQNFSGGRQATQDEIFAFMKKVTEWMDSTWYVEKYFAFGVMHDMVNVNVANQLMDPKGFPTPLGKVYLGL